MAKQKITKTTRRVVRRGTANRPRRARRPRGRR